MVDEFEETYRRATGGSVCESDTYDWDVESEAIYGVERENRTTVTRVFEDSVTTLTATSGYSREASSIERHMTADFLWTNAYGWGSSLSTLDAIESTVIEDSSAVVVGLEGGSSTYTRTIEAHNHGTTSGTSAYSSGESYSSSGGWDTDVGPTSVTYTDSWGTPPDTQPGQTPAAPEYAGPAAEDYGELAESIAARSAAAYNDPATRAAAIDAAIAEFCAVDADEQGQGGGAVFAEVSETGGEDAISAEARSVLHYGPPRRSDKPKGKTAPRYRYKCAPMPPRPADEIPTCNANTCKPQTCRPTPSQPLVFTHDQQELLDHYQELQRRGFTGNSLVRGLIMKALALNNGDASAALGMVAYIRDNTGGGNDDWACADHYLTCLAAKQASGFRGIVAATLANYAYTGLKAIGIPVKPDNPKIPPSPATWRQFLWGMQGAWEEWWAEILGWK